MTRTITVDLWVPDEGVPEPTWLRAAAAAKEAAVLYLQQEGELTIREAAMELGLNYQGYLDLLAEKRLPVSNADSDPETVAMISEAISRRRIEAA